MTTSGTASVTTRRPGSMTTPAAPVPATPAARFHPTVPAQAGSTGQVGTGTAGFRRPPVPRRGWNREHPADAGSVIYDEYVTGTGWTACVAVEVDRGAGWETVQQGRVLIESGTQATVDQLVDDLAEAAEVGERYAVVRVSAVTVDADGRALVGYLVTELPLLHRPGRRVPARPAGTINSTKKATAAYATA